MARYVLPLMLLCALSASAASAIAAGPSVEVTVDRTSLSMDDELRVVMTSHGEFDRAIEPLAPAFNVVSRSQSERVQIANGRRSSTKQLVMRLRPKSPGNHTIGAARLVSAGRDVARSAPITVTVQEVAPVPATTASNAQNLSRHLSQPMFLTAETPRTSYYVGEPFVLTWNLNFHTEIQVSSIETTKTPELHGMLAEEMIDENARTRIRSRTIAGKKMHYATRSLQLVTGLSPGRVVVDPMAMRVTTGNRWTRSQRYTVQSEPFTFDLLPLPSEGRPPEFRDGNLGRLALSASLRRGDGREPERVQVGERLILEATVSGFGNLVGVKAPVLDATDAFDVQALPTTGDDDIQQSATGVRGKRVFQYLITPLETGARVTPSVGFAFFDTSAGTYRSLRSPGIPIEVVTAVHAPGPSSPISGAVPRGEDIGPTLHGVPLGQGGATTWAGGLMFWLWLGLPLLGFGIVEGRARVAQHRSEHAGRHRERGAFGNGKKRLKLAEQALKQGLVGDFYDHVSRTFTAYFEERVNLGARGMTHDALRTSLVDTGYGDELISAVIVELENCDFARFAPSAHAEDRMRDALDRASRVLVRLDAVSPGRRP